MADNITTVIDSGLDAFSNLYDIAITFPSVLDGSLQYQNAGNISVRVGDFTPPSLTGGTYTVSYKGITLTRLNAAIDGERTFQLPIRIDAEHKLLKDLYTWKHLWVDPNTSEIKFGAYSNVTADASQYGKVKVRGYKATGSLSNVVAVNGTAAEASVWEYQDVILQKVDAPTFTRGSSDALVVQCTFLFGRYKEPTN